MRERDQLGDQGLDGRIILRWIFRKWDEGMDWIELAQGRNRWRVLLNAVMNLRVTLNAGNSLISWEPVSFSRRSLLHGLSNKAFAIPEICQSTWQEHGDFGAGGLVIWVVFTGNYVTEGDKITHGVLSYCVASCEKPCDWKQIPSARMRIAH